MNLFSNGLVTFASAIGVNSFIINDYYGEIFGHQRPGSGFALKQKRIHNTAIFLPFVTCKPKSMIKYTCTTVLVKLLYYYGTVLSMKK